MTTDTEAAVEMPERIWAFINRNNFRCWHGQLEPTLKIEHATEYIRADIHATLTAKLASLEAECALKDKATPSPPPGAKP